LWYSEEIQTTVKEEINESAGLDYKATPGSAYKV